MGLQTEEDLAGPQHSCHHQSNSRLNVEKNRIKLMMHMITSNTSKKSRVKLMQKAMFKAICMNMMKLQ